MSEHKPIDTISEMINENAQLTRENHILKKRLEFKNIKLKGLVEESFYYEQKANKWQFLAKMFFVMLITSFVMYAIEAYKFNSEKEKVTSLKSDLNITNTKLEMLQSYFSNVGDSQ